jgi:rod shape determining protein RodA
MFKKTLISAAGFEEREIIWKQLAYVILGIAAMVFFARIDYHYLRSYSRPIYLFAILLLIAVLFVGSVAHGTSGWLNFGIFYVQPIEFAKIALIIFLASFISSKKMVLSEMVRLFTSVVLTIVIIFLVIKQPDLGGAMILMAIWLGMLLLSGINKKTFFIILGAGILLSASSWFFLAGYQKSRIISFVNPQSDIEGSGYNVFQSITAIGSGGITGKGIGQGSQSQLNFLPESHNDFIFATITEELGFFGSMLILFIYAVMFYRLKIIASLAPDNFGYLVVCGIMVMLFFQVVVNIGMNMGLAPVVGITLPFLSYGGSSILVCFIAIGVALNIYNKRTISGSKVVQSY